MWNRMNIAAIGTGKIPTLHEQSYLGAGSTNIQSGSD